jgi:undecaprenyl diphosphate synthase
MNDDVKILTVYAFSSENWKRDPKEIDALMKIFAKYADSFAKEAVSRNVKVAILSTDFARLPAAVQRSVESLVSATSDCSGFLLNICLSYGGREGMEPCHCL